MDNNQMNSNDMNNQDTNVEQNWQQMPYQTDYTQNQMAPQPQNYYSYQAPVADTKDGLCIAALVLGIVGFFLNPLYVCSILAIIFGAVGMKPSVPKSNMAKAGLGLGIGSMCFQIFFDLFITLITFGAGAFTFCC